MLEITLCLLVPCHQHIHSLFAYAQDHGYALLHISQLFMNIYIAINIFYYVGFTHFQIFKEQKLFVYFL